MLLSAHAFQAGPLAASQPGFTIVDPLVASLLGVFIFEEHLQLSPFAVVIEAAALGGARGRRRRHQPQPTRPGPDPRGRGGPAPDTGRPRRQRRRGLSPCAATRAGASRSARRPWVVGPERRLSGWSVFSRCHMLVPDVLHGDGLGLRGGDGVAGEQEHERLLSSS